MSVVYNLLIAGNLVLRCAVYWYENKQFFETLTYVHVYYVLQTVHSVLV